MIEIINEFILIIVLKFITLLSLIKQLSSFVKRTASTEVKTISFLMSRHYITSSIHIILLPKQSVHWQWHSALNPSLSIVFSSITSLFLHLKKQLCIGWGLIC